MRLGKDRGFNVSEVEGELETMKTLVYECRVDPSISLRKVRQMTPLERVKLMMYKSSEENFDENLVRWLVPILRRQESREKGSYRFVFCRLSCLVKDPRSLPSSPATSFLASFLSSPYSMILLKGTSGSCRLRPLSLQRDLSLELYSSSPRPSSPVIC